MLKSCKYCGRIHESKIDCGRRPVTKSKATSKDRFRWSENWKKKRQEIRNRDKHLCQACIRNLIGTMRTYEYDNIQVHHNEPMEENYERRLDNDNLLCLCGRHHEMAEKGNISRDEVQDIIKEQESQNFGKCCPPEF